MNPRSLILAFVALSLAGLTALFARHWLDSQRVVVAAPAPAPAPVTEVLVANVALPAGTFVKPDQLRWQAWPEKGVNPAYVVKGKGGDLNAFVGGVARQLIGPGEPITTARIVTPGDRGFLAAVLQPGMRAVSVSINAETGISGLVFPGDRVDMIVAQSFRQKTVSSDTQTRKASETVLEDLRVLAIDQNTKEANEKPSVGKTVTLEVTPKQAESIAVAVELGKLSLSLRPLATAEEGAAPQSESRTGTWDREVSEALWSKAYTDVVTITVMRGSKVTAVPIGGSAAETPAKSEKPATSEVEQ